MCKVPQAPKPSPIVFPAASRRAKGVTPPVGDASCYCLRLPVFPIICAFYQDVRTAPASPNAALVAVWESHGCSALTDLEARR